MTLPQRGSYFDARLRAARRLDWRFLLPNPKLGRVGYLGPSGGRLRDSLEQFSESLTDLGHADDRQSRPAELHDVVVSSDPTMATLERAVASLRSGGWFYAEVHGWGSRARPLQYRRHPFFLRRLLARLRRLDMQEIETYWHWPDFESATTIVSLHDRAAVSYALDSRQGGLGTRLAALLGHGLLLGGVLELVIPCFSVVARRGEVPEQS